MKDGERRLVAVMFADIQGYSAMMQKDESEAHKVVAKFHDTFEAEVPKYQGTIIDFSGDGALCTFESSLGAIECAIAIQRIFQSDIIVPVRTAIHNGSVLFDRGSIYGDHVNITARIESMAIPGSILISNNTKTDIKSQPKIKTQSLGSFHFKNIEEPLEVFAIANRGIVIPKKGELSGKFEKKTPLLKVLLVAVPVLLFAIWGGYKYLDTPSNQKVEKSLVVLPFNEISSNQQFDIFLYKIRFELHHHLSRINGIRLLSLRERSPNVIGHHPSTKSKTDHDHLDYAVAGNAIFSSIDDGQFQVELLENQSNSTLWTFLYAFTEKEKFFDNVPSILDNIVKQLDLKLTDKERKLLYRKPTTDPKAFDLYIQAHQLSQSRDSIDLENSVDLLDQAIQIDSSFALAYAEKSSKKFAQGYKQYEDRSTAYAEAEFLAEKAVEIDKDVFIAHSVLATIEELVKKNNDRADSLYNMAIVINTNDATAHRHYSLFKKRRGQYTAAEKLSKRSIELSPSSDIANRNYVDILIYNQKYNEALGHIEEYTKVDPTKEEQFWGYLGDIYSRKGNFKKAIRYYEKRMISESNVAGELGYSYGYEGQMENALQIITKITKGQYKNINIAMVYAGMSRRTKTYADSTKKYLNKSLVLGVGLNVICDHPFFINFKDEYCE